MERVNQLGGDDPDDAAVPALPRHHDHGSRADLEIGLDGFPRGGNDIGLFLLTPDVLRIELLGELSGLGAHRFVRGQQQARGDVRRAHTSGGVHSRGEHEADVIAVDLLAGEPAHVEQRSEPDLVRPFREHLEPELGDHTVLAGQRNDVGERANGRDLDERREPVRMPGPDAQRLNELQRHADAREVLVGVRTVVPLRVDDGDRLRQLRVGLVMVGDDQVEAELSGAYGRLDSPDPAIDGDDQAYAEGVQTLERRRLQSISVAQPLGKKVRDVGARAVPARDAGSPST